MTEDFILTVVKIEGLGDVSSSDCILELEDKQKFQGSLFTLPVTFKLSNTQKLVLSITDSASNTVIASLSFSFNLIPSDYFYWLPLFLSTENFIDQLPLTITSPRILIARNKNFSTTPVHASPAKSTYQTLGQNSDSISIQATDLITHYQEIIKSLELEIFQIREICKQKCEKLESKVKKYKEDYECEKKFRVDLMDKIEKIFKSFEVKEKKFDKRKIEVGEFVEVKPENNTFEDRPITTLFEETGKYNSDLDFRIKEVLDRMNFGGLLRKCRESNYKIGAKVVTLCLRQGEVCCKNGLSLEKYLFGSCKGEIENFLRGRKSPKRNTSKNPLYF